MSKKKGTAKSFCENYKCGGFRDWRMPTIDELESLYSPNIINSNQPSSDCSGGYHVVYLGQIHCVELELIVLILLPENVNGISQQVQESVELYL